MAPAPRVSGNSLQKRLFVCTAAALFLSSWAAAQNPPRASGPIGTMELVPSGTRVAPPRATNAAEADIPRDPRLRSEPIQVTADASALLAMPETPAVSPAELLDQIPDPRHALAVFQKRLAALQAVPRQEPRVISSYKDVIQYAEGYLQQLERPEQVELALADCVQRALLNSYRVQVQSYNPGISQAQLIEAEAAFDAVFFLDYSYVNQDRAVATDFDAGQSDTRSYSSGIRQLLPTGMTVSALVRHSRTFTDFPFQVINPAYNTAFVTEFRQPLLRGFGLDVNRAQINIRNAQRDIAMEQFIQNVRDTLLEVETAYWQLVQARRTAAILAETVAQNRATYESVYNRRNHDATEVEIQNAKSSWDQREVEFKETIRLVRDAEDRLKNLINDPDLLLSKFVELLPTDVPLVSPLQVDLFADVRTAVDKRSEIRQARQNIEIARINTGTAKNQEMPLLDLTFQYTVDGVEGSLDNSIDRATSNRFRSYTLGVSFEYPLGNRAARSRTQVARLQESQAVVQLRQAMDAIVEEVNRAVRLLVVRWTQVPTQNDAVRAAERNLRALQARTQRIDPPYLQTELNAVEQLNNTRTRLLNIITEYTTSVVQLERAKGTLLEYNNVQVGDAVSPR